MPSQRESWSGKCASKNESGYKECALKRESRLVVVVVGCCWLCYLLLFVGCCCVSWLFVVLVVAVVVDPTYMGSTIFFAGGNLPVSGFCVLLAADACLQAHSQKTGPSSTRIYTCFV